MISGILTLLGIIIGTVFILTGLDIPFIARFGLAVLWFMTAPFVLSAFFSFLLAPVAIALAWMTNRTERR